LYQVVSFGITLSDFDRVNLANIKGSTPNSCSHAAGAVLPPNSCVVALPDIIEDRSDFVCTVGAIIGTLEALIAEAAEIEDPR
jgi:hypothetical protein